MNELLAQWPLLAVLSLAIAALYAADKYNSRERHASDAQRIARYEDRDDRILTELTKVIQGNTAALNAMNDSDREWRTRVEGSWATDAARQETRDQDFARRLETVEGLLRRLVRE